jgi:WD40 repeat protein
MAHMIVSGSDDNSVRVWDASTGAELKELKGHTRLGQSVAFSSDGTQIVSGSDDKSVRVWDASTGAELKELKGHTGSVNQLHFQVMAHRLCLAHLTSLCGCGMHQQVQS